MKIISLLSLSLVMLITACKDNPNAANEVQDNSLLLYIGTYTEANSDTAKRSEGIYVYRMNLATGELVYVNKSPYTINPSFIDVSRDGKYLYAVNEIGGDSSDGYVSAFRLTSYEKPEFLNQVSSEGDYPCYVEVAKNGKFVLVANYGSGNVAYLPVQNDGSLNKASSVDQHKGKGKTERQKSPHAHCIMVSPDGKFAYSSNLGTDRIYIYRLTGTKPELSGSYQTAEGAGPRHLTFHPSRNFVYSINELNGTIDFMQRDTSTGNLMHKQTVSTVGDVSGSDAGSADIHITPSGEFLYATNRGNFNNIASYRIHSETGELSLIGIQPVKGQKPRNFAIDPTGTYLLVANQNSDQIVIFKIDTITGRLVDTGIQAAVPMPVCIKFLPEHLN